MGTDFFTYRMLVGSVLTAPATVAIKVVDPGYITSTASAAADIATSESAATPTPTERRRPRDVEDSEEDDIEAARKPAPAAAPTRAPSRVSIGIKKKKSAKAAELAESTDIGIEMLYEEKGADAPKKGPAGAGGANAPTPFMQNLMRKTSMQG